MINTEKLEKVVAEYKKYFPNQWKDERYKWEAVKHFQDNWDFNADNFGEMFKKATDKTSNLLASGYAYPRKMILNFAKADDDAVREMFHRLYDENVDLSERVKAFIDTSEELREMYNDGTWKQHYQNTNYISTYLWLMYPDKYYIYKYELYKAVADELDDTYTPKRNGSVQNMIDGFKMYDEICEFLKADSDIRQMFDKAVTDTCYADPELRTITIDFGFYLARFYKNTTDNIPATWLLNWNPNGGWEWEDQEDEYSYWNIAKKVKSGGAVFFSWRCHSKQLKEGDRVFIIKLGPTPRGIFATGYAEGKPYETTETDDNGQNSKIRWVDICITGFLDYHTEELISQDMLKQKFPEQQWSPQGSGISIKSDAAKWLIENWNNTDTKKALQDNSKEDTPPVSNSEFTEPYTKSDFLKQVFITEPEYDKLSSLILKKKNIILQGAPGVGKTFSAKRLAYSIIGEKNENRICMVQFHQNYSYEDFIMGYRPNDSGGFELKSGVFYNFCKKCKENPGKHYFFIIDEINRGNLSKIFGELLMLIETDKRGEEHKTKLVYGEKPFYIPDNLHIIGMMNTADRSLAMIDYALRRRFSFYTMKPAFENADNNGFDDYMKKVDCKLYHAAVSKIRELNSAIRNDSSLGKGFEIGHSYFAPEKISVVDDEWVRNVIEYEIIPLIEEYWFDNDKEVDKWTKKLYQVIGEEYDS